VGRQLRPRLGRPDDEARILRGRRFKHWRKGERKLD
jgi:hypothetical protein